MKSPMEKKKKKIWVLLFSILIPHIKFQDSNSNHSWPYAKRNWQTHAEAQTNMPPQLLRSWGHKNSQYSLETEDANELVKSTCYSLKFSSSEILFHQQFHSWMIAQWISCQTQMSHDITKPTKWVCAKRRLWSAWTSAQSDQSSLSAWRKLGSLATHWAHREDSDQTGQIPRLIWVFARCTATLLVLSRGGSNIYWMWAIIS